VTNTRWFLQIKCYANVLHTNLAIGQASPLAHNSLPFRLNIRRRGVDNDTRCPVCWRLDEDGGHCFLTCTWVKRYWQTLNLEEAHIQLSSLGSAPQVVNNILDRKEEDKTLIVHMLWAWWNVRNKQMLGNKCQHLWLLLPRLKS
jgi:hypothetical protein